MAAASPSGVPAQPAGMGPGQMAKSSVNLTARRSKALPAPPSKRPARPQTATSAPLQENSSAKAGLASLLAFAAASTRQGSSQSIRTLISKLSIISRNARTGQIRSHQHRRTVGWRVARAPMRCSLLARCSHTGPAHQDFVCVARTRVRRQERRRAPWAIAWRCVTEPVGAFLGFRHRGSDPVAAQVSSQGRCQDFVCLAGRTDLRCLQFPGLQ